MLKCEAEAISQNFCYCEAIKPECLLGPDSFGDFSLLEVPVSFAKSCERDACICTIHDDYEKISKERI